MAGFSPMKYCHCKANEQNWSLSSEKHFGVPFMQWEGEKFILNFRSVASNWGHSFSVLLFYFTGHWLWCAPAWSWKRTDLSACLQQLSTKALTSWAQEQTPWQITSAEEAREKLSLPGHQAVCPGMSLLPRDGSDNILADVCIDLSKYKIQNVPATFIILILLKQRGTCKGKCS